jgi:hypothetical protein
MREFSLSETIILACRGVTLLALLGWAAYVVLTAS